MQIDNYLSSPAFNAVYFCPETIKTLDKVPHQKSAKFDEFVHLAMCSPAKDTKNVHLVWLPSLKYGLVATKEFFKSIFPTNFIPQMSYNNGHFSISSDKTEPEFVIKGGNFTHEISAPLNPNDLVLLNIEKIHSDSKGLTTQMLSQFAKDLDKFAPHSIKFTNDENYIDSLFDDIINDRLKQLRNMKISECKSEDIEEFAGLEYNYNFNGQEKLFLNSVKTSSLSGSDIKLSDVKDIIDGVVNVIGAEKAENILNSDLIYKPLNEITVNEVLPIIMQLPYIENKDLEMLKLLTKFIPDEIKNVKVIEALNDSGDLPFSLQLEVSKINPKDNLLEVIIKLVLEEYLK